MNPDIPPSIAELVNTLRNAAANRDEQRFVDACFTLAWKGESSYTDQLSWSNYHTARWIKKVIRAHAHERFNAKYRP